MISSAISHPNKALVIYWGNTDDELNTPTRTSVSMTLQGINRKLDYTVTMRPSNDLQRDMVILDGREDKGDIYLNFVRHLDAMRYRTGFKQKLEVATRKTFPVGSGLAGSAAAASALAEAFAGLVEDNLDKKEISKMARTGSGSAARSVFGGFVQLNKGTDNQSFATQLFDEKHWNLHDVIAVVDPGQKKVNSRAGMRFSTETCPKGLYSNFVAAAAFNSKKLNEAISLRNLGQVGEVYENDNILFRQVCLNTTPPLDYWSNVTARVFDEVRNLQREDTAVFAGTDAGPNVHILVDARNVKKVIDRIRQLDGIMEIIDSKSGPGSRRLKEHLLWEVGK